jgi:hypothetical protein
MGLADHTTTLPTMQLVGILAWAVWSTLLAVWQWWLNRPLRGEFAAWDEPAPATEQQAADDRERVAG